MLAGRLAAHRKAMPRDAAWKGQGASISQPDLLFRLPPIFLGICHHHLEAKPTANQDHEPDRPGSAYSLIARLIPAVLRSRIFSPEQIQNSPDDVLPTYARLVATGRTRRAMDEHRFQENQGPMQTRAVTLLRAASGMVGGDERLARRLGIDQALLSRLMSGEYELPEQVLLGTVDIILANHESQPSPPSEPAVQPARETASDG